MIDCSTYHWGEEEDSTGPLGIDYVYIDNCMFPHMHFIIVLVMFVWIVFLMNHLANTASNHFSPTLGCICDKLNLAYNIAGVTFLAFGNGAPDFFALTASVSGGIDILVALGALLGGEMFISTVVVGCIAILCPCEVSPWIFARDLAFCLVAVTCVLLLALLQQLHVWLPIMFIGIYLTYVAVVMVSSCISGDIGMTDMKDRVDSESIQTAFWHIDASATQTPKAPPPKVPTKAGYSFLILNDSDEDEESPSKERKRADEEEGTINLSGGFAPSFDGIIMEDHYCESGGEAIEAVGDNSYQTLVTSLYWQQWMVRRQFRNATVAAEWPSYPWWYKVYYLTEYPVQLMRDLTIPTLDNNSWNKYHAMAHPIINPIFVAFLGGYLHSGGASVLLLCVLIGALPSATIFCLTHHNRAPTGTAFTVLWTLSAFVMCIVWIYVLAGELVTCLAALGNLLEIPPAFLGLTVLAWGNSMGDFFTNTAVAKQGLGEMAVAGCYGGPVFNILMGLGVALLYATWQSYPRPFEVQLDVSGFVSILFLYIVLISTAVIVPMNSFKIERNFGIYLLTLYAIYTVCQATIVAFQ
ncbi:Sodium/calcium exchanger protein-domain-containing protein [Ochromonadaceae sp. CCMP2298]|nr:Sodium/calcium exchanger protein-domain-containing protein [Ochromonadaceae sp. CCMP2298]